MGEGVICICKGRKAESCSKTKGINSHEGGGSGDGERTDWENT